MQLHCWQQLSVVIETSNVMLDSNPAAGYWHEQGSVESGGLHVGTSDPAAARDNVGARVAGAFTVGIVYRITSRQTESSETRNPGSVTYGTPFVSKQVGYCNPHCWT